MMIAEHRRPFAAFLLLLAFACAIMANGLRDQVVRVFVESGAPRPLISAVVPDILLGRSLRDAPQAEPPAEEADESAAGVVENGPSSSEPATTERVVTLVRSTSAPVRTTSASGSNGGDGSPANPGPSGTPTTPTPPSVDPVVPVDPAPVRPPLSPANPGIGVDEPGTDGEVVRGHGNKQSKGFGSDKDGGGRSWLSEKKRGRDADRGHPSWGKGDGRDHPGLGNGADRNDNSSGDRSRGWRSGDRERGENNSNGWRNDARDRGGDDRDRGRSDRGRSERGDRDRGLGDRVRGNVDRGRDHASRGDRGQGRNSRGGGQGRGHR